jgi:hypothetical protein
MNLLLKTKKAFTLKLTVFVQITALSLLDPLVVLAQTSGSIKFPPAPKTGSPSSTLGGGRRLLEDLPDTLRGVQERSSEPEAPNQPQSCVSPDSKPLTALLPKALGYDGGTTTLAHPTLYFYLPQTTARQVEFVLTDANNNKLFGAVYPISGQAGIFQLSLPDNVALEKGKDYGWELALICNPQKRKSDKYVQGKLQRREISADLQAQIDRRPLPLEKAKLYARAQIWQETLSTLAQSYRSNPQAWKDLLTSAGLGEFAQAPFLNCCRGSSPATP